MVIVVSFDIDGTLEVGDPPGPITLMLVRKALELGCTIGSCSDKTISHQEIIWEATGIPKHFVMHKTGLSKVRSQFPADLYFHIGDREVDERFAKEAGFTYLPSDFAKVDAMLTSVAELLARPSA